jgi:hypothetical protein
LPRTLRLALLALVAAGALPGGGAGCGVSVPPSPTAVIDLRPSAICEGDAFATPIEISGLGSSARLSLVPSGPGPDDPPLSFFWILSGAEARIEEGSSSGPELVVRSAGDRPLHIELVVRDGRGTEARSLRTLALTRAGASDGGACGADP